MAILKIDKLSKIFCSRAIRSGWDIFGTKQTYTALNAISFDLKKGEILGLLGPNGAGKTTTIHMLLGVLTPTHGRISYFGKDFAQHRIEALKKIGHASGYDRLPARLTVLENLDVVGRMYGLDSARRTHQIEKLLRFFGIWQLRHNATGGLSAGQATRVMLAKAFIADPEIVLLDEPTASLDPDVAHEVRQFILAQRKERAVSLLITSHNMQEVTELCDRVLVLKKGAIIADNTPDQLAQSVSQVRINLKLVGDASPALVYMREANLIHTLQHDQVTVELQEQAIADFLMALSERRIRYSQISIDKPTLEDYFLSVAK
jgi:ABC-2 type transport system ATP-binding protein